jgi:hypothetical protein
MELSLSSSSLYRVVITSFMVMSDFNLKNSQIYLKWDVRVYFGLPQNQGQRGAETNGHGGLGVGIV